MHTFPPPALQVDRATAGQIRGLIHDIKIPFRALYAQWSTAPKPCDLRTYEAALRSLCPPSVRFVKLVKSPFGFQFRFNTHAMFVIRCNPDKIVWHRIQ